MVDVAQWLADLGLSRYRDAFDEHAIDGDILKKLNDDDLKELGVKALGHRKRILEAIATFSATNEAGSPPNPTEAPPARDAERRQLTLLFCDLVGSTELSGQLDPEELAEIMRSYRKACQIKIDRWGGHTAKFLGDGVLAYFGFPEAHEDDAERAVWAGLDLVRGVAELTAGDRRLSARVGIATGLVIVGELIGEGASLEEVVIGETPNLAARLQALAEPGSIAVSPLTAELVDGLFELEDQGKLALKGFAEPVQVWCVAGSKTSISRFAARAGHSLTPLVGRARELTLFDELWRQAVASEGQLLLISGEPGIGKSRLVETIGERIAGQPAVMLVCQCSPFHTNSALHPVIELLEQRAGFSQDDQDDTRLDKMERMLSEAVPADSQVFGLFASLLSLPTGRCPELDLTAQRQKDRTLDALADYLESIARQKPILFIFEDVHWIDPTSLELLNQLTERL
ncbi:MAG: AAA family ATPase, partial [Geminicoccaceae bacterium]